MITKVGNHRLVYNDYAKYKKLLKKHEGFVIFYSKNADDVSCPSVRCSVCPLNAANYACTTLFQSYISASLPRFNKGLS